MVCTKPTTSASTTQGDTVKPVKKTPLHERHLALGATMIDFAGWTMPVYYTGIIEEHKRTREGAGLFDICHMGEIDITGPGAFDFLQLILSRNLEGQQIGQLKLSVMTNERGGILDDLTFYLLGDQHYRLVTNAGSREKDLTWILKVKKEYGFTNISVTDRSNTIGKIDLQGPKAAAILQPHVPADLSTVKFYHFVFSNIAGIETLISRSGYTGEDGFEIYTEAGHVTVIWDLLLKTGTDHGLLPAGLGARDTLRLECGMMLYGSDIDEGSTPFEALYGWVVDLNKPFIGRDALQRQQVEGIGKKLIGFEMVDKGIARHGYRVLKEGQDVGVVTSGTFTPTLNRAIGLAYVPPSMKEPGTEIDIEIRNRPTRAQVVRLPFYRRPT
ncbi:MAG: glycine cleavage system aminomethyltransferase GcvT [Deltaproteobacteria bacterium]|nr:glycine cleavage system aminomethyltransferase GcvT [Deltaproteobacteria bacterium]